MVRVSASKLSTKTTGNFLYDASNVECCMIGIEPAKIDCQALGLGSIPPP